MKQIFMGNTVDEAKHQASVVFGVDESKIQFNVIEEAKKSLFGKIKIQAKVEADYNPTKTEIASEYIKNIIFKMELDSKITVSEDETGAVIDIEGDSISTVIGRRGETLDAIQYLVSMVCNKNDKDYFRITVDSCGYRAKRKVTLEELAIKISKTVLKNGRTAALEPMNPYERRIIHSAVATVEGVTSRSVGEEPYRKVIISAVNKKPFPNSERKRNDRPNHIQKKPLQNGNIRSLNLKTSFEKDYVKPVPKAKPEDKMNDTGLYGKINID